MQTKQRQRMATETLVLGAILTALVVVLQLVGSFIKFGMFSISLVLIPIVIGASVGGAKLGAWLGGVFGIVVLLSGDAALFFGISVPGTIITVMLKGIACGAVAGWIYSWLSKYQKDAAVILTALACPVVNTGVFLLGCFTFFFDAVSEWASAGGQSFLLFLIVGMVGANFVFEVAFNMLLSPLIMRLLALRSKLSK